MPVRHAADAAGVDSGPAHLLAERVVERGDIDLARGAGFDAARAVVRH
jgi:hypothetical protein